MAAAIGARAMARGDAVAMHHRDSLSIAGETSG